MSGNESVLIDEHIEGFDDGVNEDGNITFHVTTPEKTEREMLRFCPDGKILVRGEEVTEDLAVVVAFKEWMGLALFPKDPEQKISEPGFEIIKRLWERVQELEAQLAERS